MPMTAHHADGMERSGVPTLPGQDAFGAVQEIVRILEADPGTDWSKVNLEALRQHLIDMNDVTLKADAVAEPIDGGIEIAVTGTGRTVEAIQRMVPAHAHEINQTHLTGWSARTDPLPGGCPHGHVHRPQGGDAHPRPGLHRHHGQRIASPAASPRHG